MTRVLSLFPAATEIVAALGAADLLVGISHACDHPASVTHLPRVTATPIDPDSPGAVIDAQVRRLRERGEPVIRVDAAQVAALQPTVVLVQELCEVCAVGPDGMTDLAKVLGPGAVLVRLGGQTVEGVLDDIQRVGRALDLAADADELVAGIRYRLGHLPGPPPVPAPRVVSVEWLEPLYLAGHWVPELVAAAGGEEVGGTSGAHSTRRAWAEVAAMRPDVVLIMLCGMGVRRAQDEWAAFARSNPLVVTILGAARVRFVDGNAFTSRPGPRLADAAAAIRAAIRP